MYFFLVVYVYILSTKFSIDYSCIVDYTRAGHGGPAVGRVTYLSHDFPYIVACTKLV